MNIFWYNNDDTVKHDEYKLLELVGDYFQCKFLIKQRKPQGILNCEFIKGARRECSKGLGAKV